MKLILRTLAAIVIGTALVSSTFPEAHAAGYGRRSFAATLLPDETVTFVVPFNFGARPELFAYSLGKADVEMTVYDGDGNVWYGYGPWGRKTVRMNVYRSGTFFVQIRNLGPDASNFSLRAN